MTLEQSQTTVSAYLTSKHILPFGFARQRRVSSIIYGVSLRSRRQKAVSAYL